MLKRFGRVPKRGEQVHDRRPHASRSLRADSRRVYTCSKSYPRTSSAPDAVLGAARAPATVRARPHVVGVRARRVTVAGFAPLYLFPLPLVTLALLAWLWPRAHAAARRALGWWFGLGFFLAGVSWVYVSLHDFGAHARAARGARDACSSARSSRFSRRPPGYGCRRACRRRAAVQLRCLLSRRCGR